MNRDDVKVGDRVTWTGWADFGTRPVRCTGTVLSVDCGVVDKVDPVTLVALSRAPAARVRDDSRTDLDEHLAGPLLIPFEHLTPA